MPVATIICIFARNARHAYATHSKIRMDFPNCIGRMICAETWLQQHQDECVRECWHFADKIIIATIHGARAQNNEKILVLTTQTTGRSTHTHTRKIE